MHVWRDRLTRWLTPLALRCPISPNAISIIALLLNVVAAGLLYERRFLLALGFVALGGLADGFDGIVARVQNKATRYGDFLDHFCDRVSDVLLVTCWLLGNSVRAELAFPVVICVMLNGYLGTQIHATWGERRYDVVGRAEFILALIILPVVSFILHDNGWASRASRGLLITEWLSLLLLVFALLAMMERLALARRLEREQ